MTTSLNNDLLNIYGKYMHLKIYVDSSDNELVNKYISAVNEHHLKMSKNIYHIDAGFDIFCPEDVTFYNCEVNKLDFKIICSAKIIDISNNEFNTCFYTYPRSSISKSNIRLANNLGIIDAGYRGHLMGMFDVVYKGETEINKLDRYLQICAPELMPILITIVNSKEQLGEKTARGDGGFGSTGK
jgi:dUTPase